MGYGLEHDDFTEADLHMMGNNADVGFTTDDDMSSCWTTDSEMEDELMTNEDMAKIRAITNNVMHTLVTGTENHRVVPEGRFRKGMRHLRRKSLDITENIKNKVQNFKDSTKRAVNEAPERVLDKVDRAENGVARGLRKITNRAAAVGEALAGNSEKQMRKRAEKTLQREKDEAAHKIEMGSRDFEHKQNLVDNHPFNPSKKNLMDNLPHNPHSDPRKIFEDSLDTKGTHQEHANRRRNPLRITNGESYKTYHGGESYYSPYDYY